MKTNEKRPSLRTVNRLRIQGYVDQTDQEIRDLAMGNRFAYQLCTSILFYGVVTANVSVLAAIFLIAFGGVVLPNHPLDYIYNYLLSKPLGKPKLPPRSPQLKFACSIATLWIGMIIFLFQNNFTMAGYSTGAVLLLIAGLVSTLDICIPSLIFNALFGKAKPSHQ
jgi:hypothetical protein